MPAAGPKWRPCRKTYVQSRIRTRVLDRRTKDQPPADRRADSPTGTRTGDNFLQFDQAFSVAVQSFKSYWARTAAVSLNLYGIASSIDFGTDGSDGLSRHASKKPKFVELPM